MRLSSQESIIIWYCVRLFKVSVPTTGRRYDFVWMSRDWYSILKEGVSLYIRSKKRDSEIISNTS